MRVVISSGHGLKIRGASGSPVPPQCDEVDEARKVVNRTAELLGQMGVSVTTFHDDVSTTQSQNLDRIVDFHNSQTRDLDVSVHFNAFDGSAHGCEVLYTSSAGREMADAIVDAICAASGLTNRGPKERNDLAFLNGTEETAVLIETAFCDNTSDCEIYRNKFEAICGAIAEAIAGEELEPGPEPEPPTDQDAIIEIAQNSPIAHYSWKDRGRAPAGYINGLAVTFAGVVKRFMDGDAAVLEMAKADTGDDDIDALAWYRSNFQALGMSNSTAGIDTLRHLFVLLMGLGMRESSGRHCEGRDMSADNVQSDTAEAGLYQTSYNAHTCSSYFDTLMADYENGRLPGHLEVFEEGVSCSAADWDCYGSGDGADFQSLCKHEPAFAVESCAITLRNRRQHYGPINRKEAELKQEADDMLLEVQHYVMPVEPPAEDLTARVTALELEVDELDARVKALEDQANVTDADFRGGRYALEELTARVAVLERPKGGKKR